MRNNDLLDNLTQQITKHKIECTFTGFVFPKDNKDWLEMCLQIYGNMQDKSDFF